MQTRLTLLVAWLVGGLMIFAPAPCASASSPPTGGAENVRNFAARGVVQELALNGRTVVIRHEAIPGYMEAMTMAFNVPEARELSGILPGDVIAFRLNITSDSSWVDQIHKIGSASVIPPSAPAATHALPPSVGSFMDYPLTNELGQKVTLRDFQGQALAITFFYTRCPLPDFCPRLSKNFQEATAKLRALPGAPTNWHCLSISFDPAFDTPAMLKAYGELYQYHQEEWSFLTGSAADIKELARISGVSYTAEGGGFIHNFRTLIVDPAGHLQMTFPIGGDLSDEIVAQLLKATATNQPALSTSRR
jgi:protein SCO1